ncbi:RipA family octameric membrane protein [Fodinibacter luteus]|uniref:RipA family octameric membrane protein n=1 Tax=Fodinibacter luteus TaxID=552064 RepID=UPI0031EEF3AD
MKRYFIETTAPDAADLADTLWNGDAESTHSNLAVVVDQYKLYVEMADRVSARRSLANTFFLTLNTAIFVAIGVFWKDPPRASPWLGLMPLLVLVLQCLVWFWIIRSYRQLNAGKWAVVGALERRLPASPWWTAEWSALGSGKDPSRYWPLTHVEQWVPFLFAVAYIFGFIAIVLTTRAAS